MKMIRPTLLLLLASFLLVSQSACVYYQRYSMPKSRLQKINPQGLTIYLMDAAHPLTRGWYMSEPIIAQNSVTGYISKMAEIETLEASMLRNRTDAQQSRNDVIIYAKPQFALSLPDSGSLTIQGAQIEKIDVCEMNHAKTIGMPLLGCTGLALLAFIINGE